MGRAIAGTIVGYVLLGIPFALSMDRARADDLPMVVAFAAGAILGALIGGTGAIVAAIDRGRPPQSPTDKPDEQFGRRPVDATC